MSATTLGIVAAAWGVVMALSPLVQIRRMIRLGSSRDVSIAYLLVIVIGFGFWVAYWMAIGNAALVVPNALALIVGIATIAVAVHLRGRVDADRFSAPGARTTDAPVAAPVNVHSPS